MAHNSRARTGGDGWLNIAASEISYLDLNLTQGINGDDGSTHAPSSPIILGGSGLRLTAPLKICYAGKVQTAGTGFVKFGDGDVPLLSATHTGRTRTEMHPCCLGFGSVKYMWRARREDFGLQALSPIFDPGDGTGLQVARAYVPLRVHDGSTLSKVVVNFRVGAPHAQLPTTMPQVRILRVDANGNAVALTSVAAGADARGYVAMAKPANAAAWTNAPALQVGIVGNAQSFTVPCDQNNVIAVGTYTYLVELVEEQGLVGYPWVSVFKKARLASVGTNLPLNAFASLDGTVPSDGDTILVKDQTESSENGLLVAHSGAWVRSASLQLPTDFVQGLLIRVDQGNQNGGSLWQAKSSIAAWTTGTKPYGTPRWVSGATYAVGLNVFPTAANTNGYWYQATANAGTSTAGGTEPSWPTVVGQTVIDNPGANQITWTCMGTMPTPLTFVTRLDSATPAEGTGLLHHGLVWLSLAATYTNITDGRFS